MTLALVAACSGSETSTDTETETDGGTTETEMTCPSDQADGFPTVSDACPAQLVRGEQRFVGEAAAPMGGGPIVLKVTEVGASTPDVLRFTLPSAEPGAYTQADCLSHVYTADGAWPPYGRVTPVSQVFTMTVLPSQDGLLQAVLNGQLCRIDDIVVIPNIGFEEIKSCQEFSDARLVARIDSQLYAPDSCPEIDVNDISCLVTTDTCDLACPIASPICESLRPQLVGRYVGGYVDSFGTEPHTLEVTYDAEGRLTFIRLEITLVENVFRQVPAGTHEYQVTVGATEYNIFGNEDSFRVEDLPSNGDAPPIDLFVYIERIIGADGAVTVQAELSYFSGVLRYDGSAVFEMQRQ